MSAPKRRHPSARSFTLPPQVEKISTSPIVSDDPPAPSAPATVTTDARVETPRAPVDAPEPQQDATTPEEAQPTPSVASAPTAPALQSSPAPAPAVAAPAPSTTTSTANPFSAAALGFDPNEKKPTTLSIRRVLKAQAETAVLRTSGLEGGYRSWAALLEGALERELQRLADEYNGGEPFPPNVGTFRVGRPIGG